MKGTIIDYLKEYAAVSLKDEPMNDVDSLVLCQFSYLKFDGLVPSATADEKPVSLQQLYEHPDYEKLYGDERYEKENRALFEAMRKCVRFRNMKLNCYINIIGNQADFETQFSAVTFLLEDGAMYVAYRGTDETIVGWKEDFNMAFLSPVRVELLGNRQAVVDGCRGIIEYSDTCIRLSAQGLILKFTGTGLEIRAFTDSEAIVAGTILGLEYS